MRALTSTEAALPLFCAEGNQINTSVNDMLDALLVFDVYVVLKTVPKPPL